MKWSILILFLLSACAPLSVTQVQNPSRSIAQSLSSPQFGIELTFTSEELKKAGRRAGSHVVNSDASEKMQKKLVKEIVKNCDQCTLNWEFDKYGVEVARISYPDGQYIHVTLDPSVIEITGSPITYSNLSKATKRFEEDLYQSARNLGLAPSKSTGGGHIHIGLDEFFENDPHLFRDFLVDMYNNPELGSGLLANDHYNSPPIQALPKASQKEFKQIIQEFDEVPMSIYELSRQITERVYSRNLSGWNPVEKYQGVNLTRIINDDIPKAQKTVEIRSLRPQQSAEQFMLLAELFKKRRDFLKVLRGRGPPPEIENATYLTSKKKQFQKFVRYIDETGLNPEDYFKLLPSEYTGLSVEYIELKYPNLPEKKTQLLLGLAKNSAYDDETSALQVLKYLKATQEINQTHESVILTLTERHQSLFIQQEIQQLLQRPEWRGTEVAQNFKLNSNGNGFTKTCRGLLGRLMVPFARAP